ncbi:MAG: hypothetical protein HKO66_01325 [Saprospiraceae bacterium]|nr:hypothetical protein [Bacteroidia bacterium]NNE14302.1 hypothetical protein [Saprospiraceae bacterium]NNL90850.1 hypothetical protein [Saprospiraceae bacterium]
MRIIFCFFVLFFGFQSCKTDIDPAKKASIVEHMIGDWTVLESTRNNRIAKSLANSEFYITDTTFSCNFLNGSKAFPYSFDGRKISVMNPEKSVFTVRFLTTDTLILKTEIKNFDFKFTSVKKESNE